MSSICVIINPTIKNGPATNNFLGRFLPVTFLQAKLPKLSVEKFRQAKRSIYFFHYSRGFNVSLPSKYHVRPFITFSIVQCRV
ncbi:hypothetical protein CW304_05095 [Bacillus sp. UFRGS-B20]|nr:hypothetical protein CW304_05095 [Bacillus sp. UFRGS-B20]